MSEKPWDGGNRTLRDLAKGPALVVKVFCDRDHLVAGIVTSGDGRAALIGSRGFGPMIDAQSRGQHMTYCACSWESETDSAAGLPRGRTPHRVDLGKAWQVFQSRDWKRQGATVVRVSDVRYVH